MLEFIFGIIGGTALLMYGVDLMGEGLENMSSSMMKRILEKFTGKLWKAFLAGIFLTAAVQSSTAISVLRSFLKPLASSMARTSEPPSQHSSWL